MKKKNGGNGNGGGAGKGNGRPRSLEQRLDSIDSRLGSIEELLKAHSSDIRNLKNGLAYLRGRVDEGLQRTIRIEDHLGIGPPET